MKKAFLIIAIASLATYTNSFGQEGPKGDPPTPEKMLENMDSNEDGKLSEGEVKGPLKKDFAKLDLNEDGFLSREELEKIPKPTGDRPPRKK